MFDKLRNVRSIFTIKYGKMVMYIKIRKVGVMIMKRFIAIAVMGAALAMGTLLSFADSYEELSKQAIDIIVDGKEVSSYDEEQDVNLPAVIVNGRTMLPLKRTFELFDVETQWNGEERSITADTDGGRLWLQIDNKTAKLNGVEIQLDAAPTIFNSRTFVPLAFISQSMGVEPLWNGNERSVTMYISEFKKQRLPKVYEEDYLLTYEAIDNTDYYYNKENPDKSMVFVAYPSSVEQAIIDSAQELFVEASDFIYSDEVDGYLYAYKDYKTNDNSYVVKKIKDQTFIMKFKTFDLSEVIQVIKDFNGGRI